MNEMKKVLSVILITLMLVSMVACGKEETPEQAVSNMLDAVRDLDSETAAKYIDYDKLLGAGDKDDSQEGKSEADEMTILLFAKLSYEVVSSQEKGDTATVKVKITNVDMKEVLGNMLKQSLPLAFSGVDEDEMETKMMEMFSNLISSSDAKMVTNEVNLKLEKKDGQWKIGTTDELIDAILGGTLSAVKYFDDSFGSFDEDSLDT